MCITCTRACVRLCVCVHVPVRACTVRVRASVSACLRSECTVNTVDRTYVQATNQNSPMYFLSECSAGNFTKLRRSGCRAGVEFKSARPLRLVRKTTATDTIFGFFKGVFDHVSNLHVIELMAIVACSA